MRYKKFGNYGWDISCLSIGSWTLGGAWGNVDLKDSIDVVHAMVDGGVNHLDTALAYDSGNCEKVVAQCIKGIRNKLYITTKGGTMNLFGNIFVKCSSRDFINECVEQSLKNLEIDYIDNYMLHWPDANTPLQETMEALKDLKKEGKIRHVSVSNFTKEQILEAEKYCPIESVQMSYNMVDRSNEAFLKWAHDRGMGTMSYSSLGSGVLTGQYRTLPKFPEGDARNFFPYFSEPTFSKVMKVLDTLDLIVEKRNAALAQIVVNWNTQRYFIDTALCGARSVREANENCGGFDWALNNEEMKQIDEAISMYLDD